MDSCPPPGSIILMSSPSDTRLVLDVMVGGLTSILRMVGYDTVYALDRDAEEDGAVIDIAETEDRVLITRDRQIADRYEATVLVDSKQTDDQLRELHEVGFVLELDEPSRCSSCNGEVELVDSAEARSLAQSGEPPDGPDPRAEPVWQCRDCGQFYWKGSHWDDVDGRLRALEE